MAPALVLGQVVAAIGCDEGSCLGIDLILVLSGGEGLYGDFYAFFF